MFVAAVLSGFQTCLALVRTSIIVPPAAPGCSRVPVMAQKASFMRNCAAEGMPTVVPGPKKSPNAPAVARSWLRLVIGFVNVQSAFRQKAVQFARLFTGVESAEISVT